MKPVDPITKENEIVFTERKLMQVEEEVDNRKSNTSLSSGV